MNRQELIGESEMLKAIRVKYYKIRIQLICAIKYHSYNGNIKQFIRDLIFD